MILTGGHRSRRQVSTSRCAARDPGRHPEKVSRELDRWLTGKGDKTLGSLVDLFGPKSFAILFILLLGVPALPVPTGGATHVFEAIAALLALELIVGVEQIWLPQRWRDLQLAGGKRERFIAGLMRMIRRLEQFSRPRGRFLFDHRLTNIVFGLLVVCGCVGAFFAPPFTGLDTLRARASARQGRHRWNRKAPLADQRSAEGSRLGGMTACLAVCGSETR